MDKTERVDEFVALYMQHSLRLRGFVRALVPQQPDAEDVYQDVSRTLWAKFDSFEGGTNFLGWAFSIARFKVLQYRRSKARLPINMSDTVFDLIAEEMASTPIQAEPSVQHLRECMLRLSEKDRELITARYRQGLSAKSLANNLGRSGDAIYRALRRIHKSLLACIQQRIAEEGVSS